MNPHIQRADLPPDQADPASALDSGPSGDTLDLSLDEQIWSEAATQPAARDADGRAVLGGALTILAALWVGFAAWSAGRVLAGESITAPAIAQWVAIAAGPLALLGLAWIMFGRTRRRETERFTRSVVAMRSEAHSLEALLAVLSQRIEDSQSALGSMAERLMRLGDETAGVRWHHARAGLIVGTVTRSGIAVDRGRWRATTSPCCSRTCRAPKRRVARSPSSCAASAAKPRRERPTLASRWPLSASALARPTKWSARRPSGWSPI